MARQQTKPQEGRTKKGLKMSRFEEVRARVLDPHPEHSQSEIRWLEPGDEVEVLRANLAQ
jgi:hypothetical protein